MTTRLTNVLEKIFRKKSRAVPHLALVLGVRGDEIVKAPRPEMPTFPYFEYEKFCKWRGTKPSLLEWVQLNVALNNEPDGAA
jgi:hypothetical protein